MSDRKTIAVFGAYGFIGSAIVRHAAGQGHRVIALGRDEAKLTKLADDVRGEIEQLGTLTKMNAPSIETLVIDLDREFGPGIFDDGLIDMVLTPLGGSLDVRSFADLGREDFITPVRNKLAVQIAAVQAALPNLTDDAEIVLFSGLLSRHPMKGMSAMTATNAAIEALANALAFELDPITVRCVAPTMVKLACDANEGDGSVTPEDVAIAALNTERVTSGATIDVPAAPSGL